MNIALDSRDRGALEERRDSIMFFTLLRRLIIKNDAMIMVIRSKTAPAIIPPS